MLAYLLSAFVAEVPVPVPQSESVLSAVWALAQQVATFLVALGTLAVLTRPWWKRWEVKRAAEREAAKQEQAREVAALVMSRLEPFQQQVEDIHHTTTVNGNSADPRTLRDKIERLGTQVETLTTNVAAVAVNQANHTADPNAHKGG